MIKYRLVPKILIGSLCLALVMLPVDVAAQNGAHETPPAARWSDGELKWTPRTSAEWTHFGSYSDSEEDLPANAVSPDGQYFYFLQSKGDAKSDGRLTRLTIYEVASVLAAVNRGNSANLRPVADILRRRDREAPVFHQAISQVKWSENSDELYFLSSENGTEKLQVWKLEIKSGKQTKITDGEEMNLLDAYFRVKGELAIFFGGIPEVRYPSNYPMGAVLREKNGSASLNAGTLGGLAAVMRNFAVYRGEIPWTVPFYPRTADISPNGSRAIAWNRNDSGGEVTTTAFAAVDFANRTHSKLPLSGPDLKGSDAVDGKGGPLIFWSGDSTHALIVNVTAPKSMPSDGKRHVLDYNFATGKFTNLASLATPKEPLKYAYASSYPGVSWLLEGKELLLTPEATGKAEGTILAYNGNGWTARSAGPEIPVPAKSPQAGLPGGLVLEIRQDRNTPPMLFAKVGNKALALTGPDPKLTGVKIAEQVMFSWTMAGGKTLTGGLTLPPDAKPGERLPLVVQLSRFDFTTFKPTAGIKGLRVASNLGHQNLVSRGFAVLDVEFQDFPGLFTRKHGDNVVAGIDAAVEALDKKGVIDPTRVGLNSFSYSGYLSQYAVTHPVRTKFAAAIASDNQTFALTFMVKASALGAGDDNETLFAEMSGNGKSFWQDPAQWFEHDVTLSAYRSKTPMLLIDHGDVRQPQLGAGPFEQNWGMFQLSRRPFDAVFFPDGSHNLQRPAQLVAAQTVAGDWFAFWLKGEEDTDPAKAEQYQRWRMIRDNWAVQQAWEAKGNPVGSKPTAGFAATVFKAPAVK